MATIRTTSDLLNFAPLHDHVAVTKEIIVVLNFPDDILLLDQTLSEVLRLSPLLMRLDASRRKIWQEWADTIPAILQILSQEVDRNFASGSVAKAGRKTHSNPWYGQFNIRPLLGLLAASLPSDNKLHSVGLDAIKAIFLATSRRITVEKSQFKAKYLQHACDEFRRSKGGRLNTYDDLDSVLDWLNRSNVIPPPTYYRTGGDAFGHLRTLKSAWALLSNQDSVSVPPDTDHLDAQIGKQTDSEVTGPVFRRLDPPEEDLGPIPGSSRKKKPSLSPFFLELDELPETAASNAVSEPEFRKIVPAADCAHDEPAPSPAAASLEVRYTNYRSALDNQRLPWTWNKLNRIELAGLVKAIYDHQDSPGALYAWLILVSGQPLSSVLKWQVGENVAHSDCINFHFQWVHRMPVLPKAFSPRPEQHRFLHQSSPTLSIPLPKPIPFIAREFIYRAKQKKPQQASSLLEILETSEEQTDFHLREFLSKIRADRKLRITPGRIRLALQTALMGISADSVLTYLLSGLDSDMPPTGVYYSAYSESDLVQAYAKATAKILGDAVLND